MMKELMELIKHKMITSVTSINKVSSSDSDQCASQACLNLARTYEILNCLDKKETAEPIATINPAEELSDKHWEECRQIALYDDELRQARELLKSVMSLFGNRIEKSDLLDEISLYLMFSEPDITKES
jgi:hypothetical protein